MSKTAAEGEMLRFNRENRDALKLFIYNSHIHDAEITETSYTHGDHSVMISAYNEYYGDRYSFVFCNVRLFLITNTEPERGNVIISLTVEDDLSYLRERVPSNSRWGDASFYLLFQMLSGDEFHILADEVLAECSCGRQ